MIKTLQLSVLLSLVVSFVSAQHAPLPDTLKTIQLKEVVIADPYGQNALNFYQYSQLASVEQILNRTSEVALIKRGNYALEPMINGYSAGQLNITIDDMKIFGACTDRMDPVTSYVETSNMHSLEISTGAEGNKQGANIGGSLNMLLKQAKTNQEKQWAANLSTGYCSVSNGMDMTGAINYSGKKLGVRYSGTYRDHGNYTDGNGNEVLYSQFSKMNHALHALYDLGNQRKLTLSLVTDDAWDVGYPALTMDVSKAQARIYGIGFEQMAITEHFHHFKAKVYGNNITHIMDDSKRPDVPIRMDMPGWSDTYGMMTEGMWRWKQHSLTVKAEAYQNKVRAEMTMYPPNEGGVPMFMLTWPDAKRNAAGLFVQWKSNWGKRWMSTLSLRTDAASTDMTSEFGRQQFETLNYSITEADKRILAAPTLRFDYDLSNHWQLHFTTAYTTRLPTVTELYGFYLYNRFDGYDYIGNPDIENEKAWQFTAGTQFHKGILMLKGNIFYHYLTDYIMGEVDPNLMRMTVGAKGVKRFINVPNAYMAGINAEANVTFNEHWQSVNTLQYTRGETSEGDPLPMMLPLRWVTALRYQYNKFYTQGELEWSAQQERVSEAFGEQATDSYHTLNLRVGYQWQWQNAHWQVNAAAENLLDTYYRTHLDWGGIYRPGRNISLSLSVGF
ncbi:TonB-dependent receptor [Limibacter armeniacum]|uniref:TonB-dependent receptor n=1 Tax=Limibacter armeniacum TaxID=466084 RepID=UPI002FE5CA3E